MGGRNPDSERRKFVKKTVENGERWRPPFSISDGDGKKIMHRVEIAFIRAKNYVSSNTFAIPLRQDGFSSHFFLRVILLLALLFCFYAEAKAGEKSYTNDKFHYTVFYPDHWFPSGIVYGNAFEIRNYDPTNPQSVPESNRASVIIVDIENEDAEATDRFLDSLLAGAETPEQERQTLIIDGHRAVKIRRKVLGRQLGPGASRASSSGPITTDQSKFFYSISTYIADGKHIIAIEASAPVESEASVVEEIIKIEESLEFNNSKTN